MEINNKSSQLAAELNELPSRTGGAGGGFQIVFATNNNHKLSEIRQILGDRVEVLSLKDIGCDVDIPETGTTLEENALLKARYVYDHYHLSCFADDTGLEVDALGGAPGIYSARYAAMEPTPDPSRAGGEESHPQPQNQTTLPSRAGGEESHPQPQNQTTLPSRAGGEESHPQPQKLTTLPSRSGGVGGGLSHDNEANMARLLRELGENNNRHARFRTVIALIIKKDVCPCGCTSIKQEHLFEGIVEGEITREKSGEEGFGYDPIFRPDGYEKTFAELGLDIKNQISHRARATQKLAQFILNHPSIQ